MHVCIKWCHVELFFIRIACRNPNRGSTLWTSAIPCSCMWASICVASPVASFGYVVCRPVLKKSTSNGIPHFVSIVERNKYLRWFYRQLHFDFAAAGAQPQEYLLAIVQYHYVVVGEVVLTEVRTFFGHRKVTFLVWTPEQSRVVHVFGVTVVGFATAQCYPKKVFRFLALV